MYNLCTVIIVYKSQSRPTSYDPFGTPTGNNGPGSMYRSEAMWDTIHLRNREYDPTTGQFTTQDPLDGVDGTPTVAQPYHYVDNDPHNASDPLGLYRQSDRDYLEAPCSSEPWAGVPSPFSRPCADPYTVIPSGNGPWFHAWEVVLWGRIVRKVK